MVCLQCHSFDIDFAATFRPRILALNIQTQLETCLADSWPVKSSKWMQFNNPYTVLICLPQHLAYISLLLFFFSFLKDSIFSTI